MRVRFSGFEFDDVRIRLTREGRPVALRPKAFDLLGMLLRERERVVRREELVSQLWSTTSVGPGSLAGLVNELRAALGEAGHRESSIRTVHARGYQFVAPVDVVADEGRNSIAAVPPAVDHAAEPTARAAMADDATSGLLDRVGAAWERVIRSGPHALVAVIPEARERAAWLVGAAESARRRGFALRWVGANDDSRGAVSEPGPASPGSLGGRAPVALCVEVEEPEGWGRAGGLRRLLDLLAPAPVLVLAAVSARPEESSMPALPGFDDRVERVEASPAHGAGSELDSQASAGRGVAEVLRALARSDRAAFEIALGSMGFEAARPSPSRALRRVDPGRPRHRFGRGADTG